MLRLEYLQAVAFSSIVRRSTPTNLNLWPEDDWCFCRLVAWWFLMDSHRNMTFIHIHTYIYIHTNPTGRNIHHRGIFSSLCHLFCGLKKKRKSTRMPFVTLRRSHCPFRRWGLWADKEMAFLKGSGDLKGCKPAMKPNSSLMGCGYRNYAVKISCLWM